MENPLSNPSVLKNIQVIALVILVAGSIGYVAYGAIHYGFNSDEGKELWHELKLIVVAGIIASFALIGLGRRASQDK